MTPDQLRQRRRGRVNWRAMFRSQTEIDAMRQMTEEIHLKETELRLRHKVETCKAELEVAFKISFLGVNLFVIQCAQSLLSAEAELAQFLAKNQRG